MGRTAKSFLWALAGGAIYAASVIALSQTQTTDIGAPWRVATLIVAGSCYVVAGFVGRGWRALLGIAVLGVPGWLLVPYEALQRRAREDAGAVISESGLEYAAAISLTVVPLLLIVTGMVGRRVFALASGIVQR